MKNLLLIFILLSTSLSFAVTDYIWIQKERKPRTGTCYEVDASSTGQKYQVKTQPKNCRPDKSSYMFYRDTGRCYEIDDKSSGKSYSKKVNIKKCKTKKTKITFIDINGKSNCYEIDIPSEGRNYYRKLKEKNCPKKLGANYLWKPKSFFSGECYREEKTATGLVNVKTKDIDCRPSDPIFKMFKNSNFFKGRCYEIHKESPNKYIKKTKAEMCRPKNTLYIFYRKEGISSGNCFEIDTETKGENYINKVKNSKCKDQL
jgi:hypothetical protein